MVNSRMQYVNNEMVCPPQIKSFKLCHKCVFYFDRLLHIDEIGLHYTYLLLPFTTVKSNSYKNET